MNKAQLVAAFAEKSGLPKKKAELALDGVIGVISDTLAAGDSVSLVGFGTFGIRERAARDARNPRTGETVKIAAAKAPYFKAGKALRDKVNK